MKLFISIAFLIIGNFCFSQTFLPRTNGTFTPVDPFLSVPRALYIPKVCDTLVNTLHGGKDSVGAIVWDTCNHKVWVRDFRDGTKYWRAAGLQDLQGTTDIGNKTTDTIIAGGVRTLNILPDTLNDPDFEIDVLPDLQYQTMTGIPPNCSLPDSGLVAYTFNWICANKVPANIKAVLQVGDLTDDGNNSQFARVDSNYDKFDNNNIPYLYVLGNHDYNGGNPGGGTRLTSIYNTWMGPSRYTGKTYYGGNMDGTNDNYYIKLDIGRKKFIVIGLEFMPRDAVIVWAQAILDANKDRETIIVTHALVTGWGEKSKDSSDATGGYGIADANNGTELWDKLIRKNKQIIMTLNGHYNRCCGGGCASITNTSLGDPVDQRLTQTGDSGNIVHMIAYNHQSDSLGGAGHIMRLKFKPSASKIDVSFFNARYEGNDPRRPSYSLNYPAIKVAGSLGVQGQFNVAGEVTFDSSVKITTLPKWRPVITDINGRLDSVAAADSGKIFISQGANKPPKFADSLPGNSNAYIRNILPVAGATTGFQTGNFWIKGVGVVGGPTGIFSTINGTPGTFYVSHQSGNFGFVVQRAAGANASGPNMFFAHTYGSDWSAPAAVNISAELGTIRWGGTSTDLGLRTGMSLRGYTLKVGSNFVSSAFDFRTTDTFGVERGIFYLTPWQTSCIGQGITFAQMRDRLTVNGTVKILDTLKLPNILGKAYDTALYKPVIADADGNIFKLNDWNDVGGGGSMAIGGGITSATEGSVLFAGPFGVLAQDNGNFFYDDANNRLGIGTSSPQENLHSVGTTLLDGTLRVKGAVDKNLEVFAFGGDLYMFSINDARNSSPNNTYFNAGTNFIFQDFTTGSQVERARFSGNEFWIGSASDQGSYTLQNTGGIYQNGAVSLNLGSDANYDTYYRNSSGLLTRLAAGTDGHILTTHSTSSAPTWEAPVVATTLYTGDGTLLTDRIINTGGFTATWTGANNNETVFSVVNTGTTIASAISGIASGTTSIGISGTSTQYIGVSGLSTSSTGVQGESSSGSGVVGVSSTGAAFRGQTNQVSTNTIGNIVTLLGRSSSGGTANGFGAGIQYELETATNGTSQAAGSLSFEWTDATNATRTSRFKINAVNSTTNQTVATFDGNGNATFGTTNSIVGTTTNNNAVAGNIGEYVESNVVSGSAVSLTNATSTNITSISLTAGDWDVEGIVNYEMTGATTTNFSSGSSSTSATLGGENTFTYTPLSTAGFTDQLGNVIPTRRFSLSGTTTIYLVGQATFSVGSVDGYGMLRARRVR